MKQIRPLITGLMAVGVALAMATTVAAQEQGSVKVVTVKGSARYMTAGGTSWEPLKAGMTLSPGAVVQTASDSYVDFVLNNPSATGAFGSSMTSIANYQPKAEQNAVRMYENTVLGIDKLTVDKTGVDVVTETQLDLKAGRIFGTVKKLTAESKYEVKIPNGVAGIRGTVYFISAEGVVSVVSGEVVLAYVGANNAPATQVIEPMQQFDIRSGQLSALPPDTQVPGFIVVSAQPVIYVTDHTLYFVSQTQPQQTSPPPGD